MGDYDDNGDIKTENLTGDVEVILKGDEFVNMVAETEPVGFESNSSGQLMEYDNHD